MVESISDKPSGSRVISRILPPAIRFWLQTQLDHVEELGFHLQGRDREILSGHIPEVLLTAQKAIYQGLHLSQVDLKASSIRINLGQVIRRQPLRLLAPFPVSGEVCVTETDLNASLQSPLLGEGIYEFLRLIAKSQPQAVGLASILQQLPARTVLPYYQPQASIKPNHVLLTLTPGDGYTVPAIAIATDLIIRDGHHLCLENPQWLSGQEGDLAAIVLDSLQGFEIDLGPDVTITSCQIQTQQLLLKGTLRVLPDTAEDDA